MVRTKSSPLDAKVIAAIAALVTALAGGVEMRVQIGLLASKIDRIENRLDSAERLAREE